MTTSGSTHFDKIKTAFAQDLSLRQEVEWAFRLAVETYNPSDRGLRFITGGIGEWIVTLAAYKAGVVTLPDGHNADGHDTAALLEQSRALWSIKTSFAVYAPSSTFTITNGQGGPGLGLVVPTIFLAPGLPGIVYANPDLHADLVAQQVFGKDSTKLRKDSVLGHAVLRPECVIPFEMPVNPGSAIRDPGLEAVRILIDGPQFPRLNVMFADIHAKTDPNLVNQLRELAAMRDKGALTEEQYQAAVRRLVEA